MLRETDLADGTWNQTPAAERYHHPTFRQANQDAEGDCRCSENPNIPETRNATREGAEASLARGNRDEGKSQLPERERVQAPLPPKSDDHALVLDEHLSEDACKHHVLHLFKPGLRGDDAMGIANRLVTVT
jgi:hypothetical protein